MPSNSLLTVIQMKTMTRLTEISLSLPTLPNGSGGVDLQGIQKPWNKKLRSFWPKYAISSAKQISVEQFTSDTTLEYFLENKEKFILPINETPTDQQVLGLLNSASVTMTFYPNDFGLADVDGLEFDIEALKFMQNNPHHIEGPTC